LLILWAPGGFRLTCYYYRGAYYKSFWADPPSCAVGEPRKHYRRERSFPLILQNVHRYYLYPVRYLPCVINCFTLLQCRGADYVAQCLAFQQFRYHVRCIVVRANVKDGKDVRMIESASGASFLLEAAKPFSIRGESGTQDFDSDLAPQPCIAGAIDFAHSARAK
jgi:hypothetical protein